MAEIRCVAVKSIGNSQRAQQVDQLHLAVLPEFRHRPGNVPVLRALVRQQLLQAALRQKRLQRNVFIRKHKEHAPAAAERQLRFAVSLPLPGKAGTLLLHEVRAHGFASSCGKIAAFRIPFQKRFRPAVLEIDRVEQYCHSVRLMLELRLQEPPGMPFDPGAHVLIRLGLPKGHRKTFGRKILLQKRLVIRVRFDALPCPHRVRQIQLAVFFIPLQRIQHHSAASRQRFCVLCSQQCINLRLRISRRARTRHRQSQIQADRAITPVFSA